LIPWTMART